MKKVIFILMLIVAGYSVNAQSTLPRWGTGANNDNTGRVLTYFYQNVADATGADSSYLFPAYYETIVRVALTDSLYVKDPKITKSYAGDVLKFVVSGASGTKIKFATTNFISNGTATLNSNQRAVISFVFDGVKFVESGRLVQ